jgi:hypothetical protein
MGRFQSFFLKRARPYHGAASGGMACDRGAQRARSVIGVRRNGMERWMRIVLGLAFLLASTPAFALPPPPTAQVAKECVLAAYKAYPYQRPGKVHGSGARYQFYKECIEKRGNANPPPEAEPLSQPKQQ